MSDHTREPWTADNGDGEDWGIFPKAHDDREAIAYLTEPGSYSPLRPEQAEANARRIVACVNACAGILTEVIESFDGTHDIFSSWKTQQRELTALRAQVADLRAALEPFAEEVAGGNLTCHRGVCAPDECARCGRILRAQRVLAATQSSAEKQPQSMSEPMTQKCIDSQERAVPQASTDGNERAVEKRVVPSLGSEPKQGRVAP